MKFFSSWTTIFGILIESIDESVEFTIKLEYTAKWAAQSILMYV